MKTEELVAIVRAKCVDQLVEGYGQRFSETPLELFTEVDLRELASAWKAASPELRVLMKAFMRLGSQNTAASVLALMDEDSGLSNIKLTLIAKGPDGSQHNLSRDLLNCFWEQEESAGRVNRTRR